MSGLDRECLGCQDMSSLIAMSLDQARNTRPQKAVHVYQREILGQPWDDLPDSFLVCGNHNGTQSQDQRIWSVSLFNFRPNI